MSEPKEFNFDLDPEKTLDYALFQRVATQFMNPTVTRESMGKLIERLEAGREPGEDKRLPPLNVIIYKDLVEVAWSWDRLLPWMSCSLLFEDYFNYLEEYYSKNFTENSASLNLQTAAAECIQAEEVLIAAVASHAGQVTRDPDLSTKIKEQAHQLIDSAADSASIVPAACFQCIAAEAKLISRLAECISVANKSMAQLWQRKVKFSEKVRKAALDILITYKGPYSRRVSASLLGMKKEASIACELLNMDTVEEEKMHTSVEIRTGLLELFNIIIDYFPPESSVKYYPIDKAYPAITSENAGYLPLDPSKEIRSTGGSFPVTSDKIVKTPITPNSSAPSTPLSCFASSLIDEESVKDTKTNRKRKGIVGTQESEMPNMQSSETWSDEGLLVSQITSDGEPRYGGADGGYRTNNSATTTPLSCAASSTSAEEYGKDIEINKKRRSMGGTKDSVAPRKDDEVKHKLGSQISIDFVAPALTHTPDKFSRSLSSISRMDSVDIFSDESEEDSTKKSKSTCDIQGSGGSSLETSNKKMENAQCEKMSRISGSGSEVDSLQPCNTAMENPDDEKC